jgi:hypothetical protein
MATAGAHLSSENSCWLVAPGQTSLPSTTSPSFTQCPGCAICSGLQWWVVVAVAVVLAAAVVVVV